MNKIKKAVDSFCQKKEKNKSIDWSLAKFIQKNKKESTLFFKHGKTKHFKTETLNFHFVRSEAGVDFRNIDSICRAKNAVRFRCSFEKQFDPYREIQKRYLSWKNYLHDLWRGSVQGVSLVRMWNVSLVGALIFGMFIMTFIYRYLGQGAAAVSVNNESIEIQIAMENEIEQKVLGEETNKETEKDDKEVVADYVTQIMTDYQEKSKSEQETKEKTESLKNEIETITKGYPIEVMAPYIAKQDRIVAAFLVAIAKKESNWGKRVPVLDGEDCYNYWGYRGKRERMGTGGHTCFDSPEDAVKTVAKRINFLVTDEKLNTPEKLVVWKCGYDCSWDNPGAVRKWISDVDQYFSKFNKEDD